MTLGPKQYDSENYTSICTLQAIVLLVLGQCFLIYACYFADPVYLSTDIRDLSYCLSKETFTRGMMFRILLDANKINKSSLS